VYSDIDVAAIDVTAYVRVSTSILDVHARARELQLIQHGAFNGQRYALANGGQI
jgi:hypothetical protein